MKGLWDKTSIPNHFDFDPGKADRKILEVLKQGKLLLKTPTSRRDTSFASNMCNLLDMSLCTHKELENCTCPAYHKVPSAWVDFLQDQRGLRMQCTTLNDRSLSLRAASRLQISQDELKARQEERWRVEARLRRKAQEKVAKEKSEQEKEILLNQVSHDNVDWEDFGPTETVDTENKSEETDDDNCDSDWEDMEDNIKITEYNTLKLKNFARECDRYKVSNRAGAKIGNALLKDLKLVTKNNPSKLICPGKLRRERLKWGGELEKAHSAKLHPAGLYNDGKKCPTLVIDTSYVQVQVSFSQKF